MDGLELGIKLFGALLSLMPPKKPSPASYLDIGAAYKDYPGRFIKVSKRLPKEFQSGY